VDDTSFRVRLVALFGARLDGVTLALEAVTNWELIPVWNEKS
jgi:hypothetical protein